MDKTNLRASNILKGNISSGVALPKLLDEFELRNGEFDSESESSANSTSVSEDSSDPEIHEISKNLEKKISIFKSDSEDKNNNNKEDKGNNTTVEKSKLSSTSLKEANKKSSRVLKTMDPFNAELAMNLTTVQKSMADLEKKYRSFNEEAKRITMDSKNAVFSSRHKSNDRDGAKKLPPCTGLTPRVSGRKNEEEEINESTNNDHAKLKPPIVDSTATKFGLDPNAILNEDSEDSESSTESSSETENSDSDKSSDFKMKVSLLSRKGRPSHPPRKKKNRVKEGVVNLDMTDKAFMKKFKVREDKLSRNLNGIRNQLDSLHHKIDGEKRRAQILESKKPLFNRRVREIKKPVPSKPNEEPGKKLSDFLQATGGKTGSWKADEHNIFLRAYNKFKNEPDLMIENILKEVPNKTGKNVMAHVNWYEEFESLSKAKKNHIRQWTDEKRREKEMIYQMGSLNQKARLETEKRRQEQLQAKREEERERNRERLLQWRKTSRVSSQPTESFHDPEDLDLSQVQKELTAIGTIAKKMGTSLKEISAADTLLTQFRKNRKMKPESGSNPVKDNFSSVKTKLTSSQYSLDKMKEKSAESKKMMEKFRERDNQMIAARQKAILKSKDDRNNKYVLTVEDPNHMKRKLKVKNNPMGSTTRWQVRRQLNEVDKVQHQEKLKSKNERFQEVGDAIVSVPSIPKLGIPDWKKD